MIKKALKLLLVIGGILYVVAITVRNTYASSSRVETVNYQTQYRGKDYRKSALVYLPPNYSSSHRYSVIYLVHGSTETPRDFFRDGNFQRSLDQLISSGKLKPSIVVFPTYYPNRSFVTSDYYRDNRPLTGPLLKMNLSKIWFLLSKVATTLMLTVLAPRRCRLHVTTGRLAAFQWEPLQPGMLSSISCRTSGHLFRLPVTAGPFRMMVVPPHQPGPHAG